MVTVILLALSTSVGSVIGVIPISDDMFAVCPTVSNDDATFICAILSSATTCYRKEERARVRGQGEGGGERAGEEG